MKFLQLTAAVVMTLAAAGATRAQTGAQSQCIACHMELESDEGPAHDFAQDIHAHKGLGCPDCHGGNPALEDMDEVRASANWRGVPAATEVPEFCARCHADAGYMHEHNPKLPIDQLEKYRSSVHGQRLFKEKDAKVATCVSCHTAHRIGDAAMPHSSTNPVNMPATCGACHSNQSYMAPYGIPTDQEAKYRKSVHGRAVFEKKDLAAPVCNDCHGNHGAAPPGVGSLSAVCGTCHALEADLYNVSPHFEAFQALDMPMCETCHGNHEIEAPTHAMIGLGDGQICGTCHSSDDGTEAPWQIDSMSAALTILAAETDSARLMVGRAAGRGMMVTDEEFALKEIDQIMINLRAGVHAFAADSILPPARDGLEKSRAVRAEAGKLIDEYYFRRWGLGISSILITLLAVALFLKIRSMDKHQA